MSADADTARLLPELMAARLSPRTRPGSGPATAPATGRGETPTATPIGRHAGRSDCPYPRRVGDYELGNVLGRGGSAIVLLAYDVTKRREAAVKLTRPQRPGAPPTANQLCRRERSILERLSHPSVVPLLADGCTEDGRLWLAMPQLRGPTLRGLLNSARSARPDVRAALVRRVLLPSFEHTCEALRHAHARGVLHNDLKPSNVVRDGRGRAVLIDWGIGELRGADSERFFGTAGYAAPERLLGCGSRWDERSDVWSLGAILYEMVTGVRPYGDAPDHRVLGATLAGPPPRADLRSPEHEHAAALAGVCERAMAACPRDRYRTVTELVAAVTLRAPDAPREQALRASVG